MNCKPGDLAVIVKPGSTARNLGRVVLVVRQGLDGHGWWFIESQGHPCHIESFSGKRKSTFGDIEDHRLRPIRDPGDDATDETLLWTPVPTKEVA